MTKKVRVYAPATVANVACGFDILGFALDSPGDELTATLTDTPGVVIEKIEGAILPYDPIKNSAGAAAEALLGYLKAAQGVSLTLHKKMPLESGLGSSAASAAAAVFAVNKLFNSPLSTKELIAFAMEGERAACGSAHADNVAPALLGGFVLVRSYSPLDVQQIPCFVPLFCAVLHPHIAISTGMARELLTEKITLKQHVEQSGNIAGLVLGLTQGNVELIRNCLQDVIVEPLRAPLISNFYFIKAAALEAGALGCSLSGSGPSLFALATSLEDAQRVCEAMKNACKDLSCDGYVSRINQQGVRELP